VDEIKMNNARFQQIDALFDEVLDVPTIERERILDERCCEDVELKREVLALIAALDNSTDFIEKQDFIPAKNFLDEEQSDKLINQKIGAYRLKKLLGRGGMGAVYLASRIDDFEKEVAVKIIPPFEHRRQSAENFRRERQILARLEHPFIAQILDGGTTGDNTPFLVMEYVDGLPLNEFCRENNCSVREKLALFQDVCQAVTFAHQNFIVHRDLKPNNILVTKDGTPKLLDFGIAKTLDFSENKTIDSGALTPEYASPEQINGENITAASDVYSLGVVLYELLTGERPHKFKNKSLNEIVKIIQTKEPLAPSVISNYKVQISDSELDSIVLKSLCKSPLERYHTVEEFRADIENYLNDLPISARPNTLFYRFEKYAKRHKFETAIAAVFILILFGWLITAILQAKNAERQARENRRTAYSAEMILAANEYENANLNRLRAIVEKYQPPENEEDLRGFEWYFLKNLLDPPTKIGSFQHPDEVWNAEFSPDGKFIATACNDNIVRVWNVENGQMIETAEQKGAWKVSFFPDGKKFAVTSSSNSAPIVKIYETATAKEIFAFKNHTKRIRAIDVAPDGKTIATGSQDGNIIVWNAATGAELKRFSFAAPPKSVEFYDVQFSKNGDKLVVLGSEILTVFDTKTWTKKQADVAKFLDKNIYLNGWKVVFSPLEKTLAIGTFNGDVVFVDSETLEILRVLKIHQSNVKTLAFTADGKTLITGSGDRTVKFVDVQTGEVTGELRGHFSGVHEVALSPDGTKLATASADFSLNFWNTSEVSKANSILTNSTIFAFSKDVGKMFAWNNTSFEISAWNLSEKAKNWAAKTNINAFSTDLSEAKSLIVFGERDGFISLFDTLGGREIRRSKTHERNIYSVVFAPDGAQIFAGYEDGLIKCFETDSGAEIFAVQASNDIIKTMSVSPDGKIFASGGNDKLVKLFDTETGKEIAVLEGNTKPLYKTAFSANGEFLAAVGADDIARIWRVSDKKLVQKLSGMSAGIFAVAFAPDGKRLATASDVGVIRLWNTETGEQVLAFTASQKQINYLKFSADGKTLISVDANGKVSFWNGN
jgi:eukaryotic-like serine/threonine-protein kinase